MRRMLFQPVTVLLSTRYLLTKDATLLFVMKTALVGLVLSVTVLLVVQGVIAGFQRDLNRNILALVPHVTLSRELGLSSDVGRRVMKEVPEVTGFASVVQSVGLASTEDVVRPIQLIGIDPTLHVDFARESPLSQDVNWEFLKPGEFGVLLGINLADKLRIGVGDKLLITLASGNLSPLGFFPRQKRFTVVGLANTQSSLDALVSYIHREDARRLLKLDSEANGIFFRLADPLEAQRLFYTMYFAADEPELLASQWRNLFGALYDFLVRFKQLLFLMLALLVAVATFNLVSSMVMLVHSRRDDIAVLQTLGSNRRMILASFVMTGLVISVVSLALASAVAYLVGLFLPDIYGWLAQFLGVSLSESFALHRLSVVFQFEDLLRVFVLTLGMVVLGSLYPAYSASKLAPAEVLRDE